MLFQWDITHDPIDRIITTFWESVETPETPEVIEFANALATGTIDQVEKIDVLLQRHAEHWRLDRMAGVDRNLLRLATYEFLDDAKIPKAVIINEAIEIAAGSALRNRLSSSMESSTAFAGKWSNSGRRSSSKAEGNRIAGSQSISHVL
jgi:N utilization substance protein B